jgi:hypothetical protein
MIFMLDELMKEPGLVFIAIIFLIVIIMDGKRRKKGKSVTDEKIFALGEQMKKTVPQISRQNRQRDWPEVGLVKQMKMPRR